MQQYLVEYIDDKGETLSVDTVRILPIDHVKAERIAGGALFKGENISFEAMYKLAWTASTRLGRTTASFDAWLETIGDINAVEIGNKEDPKG